MTNERNHPKRLVPFFVDLCGNLLFMEVITLMIFVLLSAIVFKTEPFK